MIIEEFLAIKSALNKASRVCISDLFNSAYKLTDEYCSGCNSHEDIIGSAVRGKSLKLAVESPISAISDEMKEFTDNQKEMMIYSEGQNDYLFSSLSDKGLDIAVVNDVAEFRKYTSCKDNTTLNVISFERFFELFSERNYFYTSGSIAFFIEDNQRLVERILSIRSKAKGMLIYIVNSDIFIPSFNKNLSEIVNGACFNVNLLKGDS